MTRPPPGVRCAPIGPGVIITMNGEPREVPDGRTLEELLAELSVQPKGIAVELNEAVVPRSVHATTTLRDGDRVEVVSLIGGG